MAALQIFDIGFGQYKYDFLTSFSPRNNIFNYLMRVLNQPMYNQSDSNSSKKKDIAWLTGCHTML